MLTVWLSPSCVTVILYYSATVLSFNIIPYMLLVAIVAIVFVNRCIVYVMHLIASLQSLKYKPVLQNHYSFHTVAWYCSLALPCYRFDGLCSLKTEMPESTIEAFHVHDEYLIHLMSHCVCLVYSPAKWGATVRSLRCCVLRTNRAGPAGWLPSDCLKYFLYFHMFLL